MQLLIILIVVCGIQSLEAILCYKCVDGVDSNLADEFCQDLTEEDVFDCKDMLTCFIVQSERNGQIISMHGCMEEWRNGCEDRHNSVTCYCNKDKCNRFLPNASSIVDTSSIASGSSYRYFWFIMLHVISLFF